MVTGVFDGASRGNPGPAGAGAALLGESGEVLWQVAHPLGVTTNNVAEWTALKLLVEEIDRRGLNGVLVQGDSQLVINQASGSWKINNAALAELAKAVMPLIRKRAVALRWVRREENQLADRLSNEALDGASEAGAPAPSGPRPVAEEGEPHEGDVVAVKGGYKVRIGGNLYLIDLKSMKIKSTDS